jgi:hypothetical protein
MLYATATISIMGIMHDGMPQGLCLRLLTPAHCAKLAGSSSSTTWGILCLTAHCL